jgi:SAM-dependent methyltransferase
MVAGVSDGGRIAWEARHRAAAEPESPSPFVVAALARLGVPAPAPRPRALDLACGRGRHALLLAGHGYHVDAIDHSLPALSALHARARALGLPVACLAADLTTWPLPAACYHLVVVVNYLERALLPAIGAAVAPGGALLVETFLRGQERHGHPSNPDYLLARGELERRLGDWEVLAAHEGPARRGRTPAVVAGILARRPHPGAPITPR